MMVHDAYSSRIKRQRQEHASSRQVSLYSELWAYQGYTTKPITLVQQYTPIYNLSTGGVDIGGSLELLSYQSSQIVELWV